MNGKRRDPRARDRARDRQRGRSAVDDDMAVGARRVADDVSRGHGEGGGPLGAERGAAVEGSVSGHDQRLAVEGGRDGRRVGDLAPYRDRGGVREGALGGLRR